jgi:hypothetical protein
MSLVVSPVQAAAIMLPILIAMDWVGVAAYRREFDLANLKILLPAAIVGIGAGYLTAAFVTEAHVRLVVGIIAVAFALDHFAGRRAPVAAGPSVVKGSFWGLVAGFTSFVSHAGGPPVSVYLLPQRLANAVYAATTVMFFTVVNLVKVVPYFALGQFGPANLATTGVLLPLAPLAMMAGIWATRRIPQAPFYTIAYASLLVIGVKLIWDGLARILW